MLVIHEAPWWRMAPAAADCLGGRFAAMYASWDELNQVQEAEA